MTTADGFAPAKINLTLHVTGRRNDGYHLLDSLVAFADIGDTVSATPGDGLSLRVKGPAADGVPDDARNLVIKAARWLAPTGKARLVLDKQLPAAAGIGGGSSDAAAALRVLARLWRLPLPDPATTVVLGADVPVCLARVPVRMRGIGEHLAPVPALPEAGLVLVNPRVEVATATVFRALARADNPPMPETLPRWPDAATLAAWLREMRNDLAASAMRAAPVIEDSLAALRASGSLFAGMSGSGATCFGLFETGARARAAVASIARAQPGWWCAAGSFLRV